MLWVAQSRARLAIPLDLLDRSVYPYRMRWFGKRKTKIAAEILASVMTDNLLQGEVWRTEPLGTLQEVPLIEAKLFFYKQALLMVAIYTKKHSEPEFWKLERAVEAIIYSDGQSTEKQITIRIETENAIKGVRELLNNITNDVTWSRKWFADIDCDVDPTFLSVFGLFLLGQLEAMIRTLDEFQLA